MIEWLLNHLDHPFYLNLLRCSSTKKGTHTKKEKKKKKKKKEELLLQVQNLW